VFVKSYFVLNIIFCSMLSIFELCQRKHGSCDAYIREVSESYSSRLTQDLEFIFYVPIKNTMIKNSQDKKKRAYEILHESVALPFNTESVITQRVYLSNVKLINTIPILMHHMHAHFD
jgi:hypothetical protein